MLGAQGRRYCRVTEGDGRGDNPCLACLACLHWIEQRRSIPEMVYLRGVAFVLRGYLREHSAQAHMTGAMQTEPYLVMTLHM